jgi:hypothetical protein
MMTFGTHKFVKTLEAAGISPQQAEAFSDAVRDSHDVADLATKFDLPELEMRIDAKFLTVDAKFADVRGEMMLLKWMMGLLIAGVASLVLKAFL